MSSVQQGDVLLVSSSVDIAAFVSVPLDEFGIQVLNGVVTMTGSFETAAQLSMFGGNFADDGVVANPFEYWGNLLETEPERQYRSQTQFLLQSMPATSANLLRLDAAGLADLQWFLDLNIASDVTVESTIPGLNRVDIDVAIVAKGVETQFTFTENWKASPV